MQFDLDSIDDVLEWDFSLASGSRVFSVRPLTLGDLGRLLKLSLNDPDVTSVILHLLKDPSDEARQWLQSLRPEKITAIVQAIVVYVKQVISKNSPAVASKIAMLTATTSPPSGASTQP